MSYSKKRVKYVAPMGNSGYAEAAKDYMIGLHNSDVDVTHQYFKFDNTDHKATGKRAKTVRSLINKKIDYDTVIVHSTPEHWAAKVRENKGKRIIGMTVWETTRLHPEWIDYINGVHHVVVPCEWNKQVFIDSGITRPITVIPHIIKPQKEVEATIEGVEDEDYKFYTIGQWHNRKGIHDTIHAYLKAFTSKDDTVLIIKTFGSDFSVGQQKRIESIIRNIVSDYSNPAKIVLVLKELNQSQIEAIHTIGDCYVSLCKSEGWGLGAFDAAGRGKPVIMTGFGGQMDFLKKGNHRIVDYSLIPVGGMEWIKWYNRSQSWAQPSLEKGAEFMREVYEKRVQPSKKQSDWVNSTFGEGQVIRKLKKLLI